MPRTASRPTFIRGRVARVTRVDACGRPVYGEYSQATTEGIITAAFTANTTQTDEINQPNFSGKNCVYEAAETSLAGYGVELTFCNVDFDFFEIMTKQTLVVNDQNEVIGIESDTKVDLGDEGFALEVWVGTQGTDVCDDEGAQGAYGYVLLPLIKGGIMGDFTIENGSINFVVTGASTRDGNRWGSGPYPVELVGGSPAPLYQPLSSTAPLRLMQTSVAPPPDTVGARPLLDSSLSAIDAITAEQGETDMEATFTLTTASDGSVWWEFGDGTWDYVAAPGGASHVYESAGTYTAKASQNGIDWTSVEVTVPFV